MDTREKIIPFEQFNRAIASGLWIVIAGLFDPLTAIEADRIAFVAAHQPTSKLAVVVLEGDAMLLPVHARCALIASLRSVQLVTPAQVADLPMIGLDSHRVKLIANLDRDREHSLDFQNFVLARHEGGAQR